MLKPRILDCDRHVIEPMEIWQHYTESTTFKRNPVYLHKGLVPQFNHGVQSPPIYMLGEHPILSNWGQQQQLASAAVDGDSKKQRLLATHPEGQIASMDQTAVYQAKLFPTFAMYIVNHQYLSPEDSLEYARAYNRWLLDYCSTDPLRLQGVGLISRHSPATLVEQLEAIRQNGWNMVTIRPEPIKDKTLGHSDYEEFWQACAAFDITVALHGGTHLQGQTVGMDRFSSRFALHACSHPMEAQMAFVTLLESGVLQRNPDLKCVFLEAGAAWLPHWLWRLDQICFPEFRSITAKNITLPPSEYFRRQCWVSVEPGEPCLGDAVNCIGLDKLIYGSDFPHPDHLHLTTENHVASLPGLDATASQAVYEKNAAHFFVDTTTAPSSCMTASMEVHKG